MKKSTKIIIGVIIVLLLVTFLYIKAKNKKESELKTTPLNAEIETVENISEDIALVTTEPSSDVVNEVKPARQVMETTSSNSFRRSELLKSTPHLRAQFDISDAIL